MLLHECLNVGIQRVTKAVLKKSIHQSFETDLVRWMHHQYFRQPPFKHRLVGMKLNMPIRQVLTGVASESPKYLCEQRHLSVQVGDSRNLS